MNVFKNNGNMIIGREIESWRANIAKNEHYVTINSKL